jgi:hypothetical protein
MESQKNITHMKTCLNIPYSIYASDLYIYIHTYSHIHINNFCRLDLHVSQHSMSPFLVVISPFGGLESPLLEFPVGSIMIVRPIFPWGGSSSIFAFRNQNLSTSDSHYFA